MAHSSRARIPRSATVRKCSPDTRPGIQEVRDSSFCSGSTTLLLHDLPIPREFWRLCTAMATPYRNNRSRLRDSSSKPAPQHPSRSRVRPLYHLRWMVPQASIYHTSCFHHDDHDWDISILHHARNTGPSWSSLYRLCLRYTILLSLLHSILGMAIFIPQRNNWHSIHAWIPELRRPNWRGDCTAAVSKQIRIQWVQDTFCGLCCRHWRSGLDQSVHMVANEESGAGRETNTQTTTQGRKRRESVCGRRRKGVRGEELLRRREKDSRGEWCVEIHFYTEN